MIKIKPIYFTLSIFAIALLLGATVYADYAAQDWKYLKTITLPEMSGSEYIKAKLDHEILAHSPTLNDLRIISNGKEVGYQLVAEDETLRNAAYPSQMLNLSSQNGGAAFIVDLGTSGAIHSRISIITSSLNFKRQVSVYAADTRLGINDPGWRLLTNKSYVYNFYDADTGFNAGSGEISYPQSTSQYLKVVINNGEGVTPQVSGVRVYRYEIQNAEEDLLTVSVQALENKENESTELTLDLGAPGIPTHSVTLESDDKNFSRRAVVQGSTDGEHWTLIGQGTLFNIETSLFVGKHLTLEYPEQRYQYLRIVVFNEDNEPVHFGSSSALTSVARYVVFNANPGSSYELAYGNPSASTPRYDISKFFEYIESRILPTATLSAETPNASYVAPIPPLKPFTERYPYLLTLALIFLAAIIAAFIVFYLKKLEKTTPQ